MRSQTGSLGTGSRVIWNVLPKRADRLAFLLSGRRAYPSPRCVPTKRGPLPKRGIAFFSDEGSGGVEKIFRVRRFSLWMWKECEKNFRVVRGKLLTYVK